MISADQLLDGNPAQPTPIPASPADAMLDQPEAAGKTEPKEAGGWDVQRVVKTAGLMAKLSFTPDKPLPRAPTDLKGPEAVAGGAWNAIAPYFDAMHSPGGLAMGITGGAGMGLLSLAKASPAALAALVGMKGAVSALMVPGAKESDKELARVLSDPKATLEEKVQAQVGVVAANASVLLPWLHTVEAVKPEALDAIKDKPIEQVPHTLQEQSLEAEKPQEKAVLMHTAEAIHEAAPTEPTPVPPPPEERPVPSEQVQTEQPPAKPEEQKLIGIKNVAREEAAEARGDEAPKHGEATTDEAEQAKAQAKLAENPNAGRELIEKLAKKVATGQPTNVNTSDVFLASHEMVSAENERTAAESQYLAAEKSGDLVAKQDAEQRIARARDYYTKVSNVVTQFGTEQAQAFRARAVMFRDDYSIASMERQLSAATKDGRLTPEHESFIRRIQKSFVQTREQLEAHETKRLAAAKRRLEIQAEEIGAKLQRGDLQPDPKPEPVKLDAVGERLKAAHESIKQEFQEAVVRERLENRTPLEKLEDLAVKWRRGFVLSGPVTLAKLTAATAFRMVSTPLEDAVAGLYDKVPVVRELFKGAPVEGSFNARALAKGYTQAWMKGLRDAAQTLKNGKSDLDILYGKGKDEAIGESDVVDRSIIDYIGNVHGALKAPLKRFSYEMAMQKQFDWAVRNGIDAGDPVVQTAFSNRAYRKAQANLFLQDNVFNDAWKSAVGSMERSKTSPGIGKAAATAAHIAVPITKVPTNMVGEGIEYTTGLATGSFKLAKAWRAGFDTLTADQKDVIARNLKKGTLGAGGLAMLLGYFTAKDSPVKFGGFYQPGEKRKKSDVPAGSVRVFGEDVPSFLLDHPVFQTFQIGATALRVANSKIRKGDRDAEGWMTGLGAASLGLIDETPFGREDVEAGQVIGGDPAERQYRWGEFVKGLVVPEASQFAAKETDKDKKGQPIQRKETTVMEHVESGIPVLRETLPKRKIDHSER